MQVYTHKKIRRMWLWLAVLLFLGICTMIPNAFAYAAASGKAEAVLDETEQYCTINLADSNLPSDSVFKAAVWSDEGGQDDLVWYTMTNTGNGLWQTKCKIAAHHSAGIYRVHIYQYADSGPQYQTGTTFRVAGIISGSVSAEHVDEEKGSCQVLIKSVTSPSGIADMRVAVWSKDGQSDLMWYSAKKQSENEWAVDMDIANHKYNFGTYLIHVYATNNNGITAYAGGTRVTFTQIPARFLVVQENQQWHLKAENAVYPGGIQQVCFAVWSKNNGQDDLRWYYVNYDSTQKQGELYSDLSKHGDTGIYISHVYAQTNSGAIVYLCGGQFKVEAPTAGSMSVTTDNVKGSFSIALNDVQSSKGISSVKIAVWSQDDQGDLVWYQATKYSEDTYVVSGDISKHKYHITNFKAHAYLYDVGNHPYYLNGKAFSFPVAAESIRVDKLDSDIQYQITVSGVSVPAGARRLSFAVWSDTNGQDDLVWYDAKTDDGSTYVATVSISNHKSPGKYYAHGYVELRDGTIKYLKGTSFQVEELPYDKLFYYNMDIGCFDVSIHLSHDVSDIESVYFPTWRDGDQNDICWYELQQGNNNTYTVTVNAANHKFHYGTYITHVYLKDKAGNTYCVTGGSCTMQAPDPVTVSSCTINGDQVVLQARVDGTVSHEYGLFQLQPGQSTISASSTPLATAAGTSDITLQTPLNLNTANSLLQAKLAIGLKVGDRYLQVTSGNYITNPEAVAGQTFAFPTTSSKKGLQIHTDYMNDVNSLGVKHAVLNLTLNALFSNSSSGIAYNYNGSTYYFDSSYISYFDRITSQLSANGTVTSMVVLLQWNPATNHLIIPSGRTAGHSFYGLNTTDPAAKKQLEAAFTFLGQRYANSQHKVVNWIMGNEVADYNQYYWCGDISQEQYVEYYTDAYRMLYNSLKSVYSNARVYISLDQCWNYQRAGTYTGKTMLDSFAAKLSSEGNVSWNLAFHPYPFPLTSANFWNSSSLIQDNANSPIITMKNLRSLTDYIKYTYGSDKRFILSETGFTSVSNGTKDEILQAAAIAYAYYLAEFNDMVDAFVVHRHVDHRVEMNMGLYLGLWANENGSEETPTRQKYSWVVFQKMDTNQSLLYTNFALPYIGASDWYSVVPGFNPGRFQ